MKNIVVYSILLLAGCSEFDVTELTRRIASINVDLESIANLYEDAITDMKAGDKAENIKSKYQSGVLKLRKKLVQEIKEFNTYCDSTNVPADLYNAYMDNIDNTVVTMKVKELEELGVTFDLEINEEN